MRKILRIEEESKEDKKEEVKKIRKKLRRVRRNNLLDHRYF